MADSVDIQTLGIAVEVNGADKAKEQIKSLGDEVATAGQKVQTSNAWVTQYNDLLTAEERAAKAAADAARKLATEQQALGKTTSDISIGAQLYLDKLREQAIAAESGLSKMAAQAEALGIAKSEYEPLIAQIEKATAANKQHGFSLDSNLAKMELMRIAHDAAIGSYTRMGSAMLVFGNASGATSALMNPSIIGFVALAAAVAFAAYEINVGHEEMIKLNNTLAITNSYAGLSREQMTSLAVVVSKAGQMTVGSAQDLTLAFVESGRIGGAAIGGLAQLTSNFAKSTGQDVDKVAPMLIKLFSDPIKGAQTLNEQMHFLTITDMEHIKTLQELGDVQGAQYELMVKLTNHIPDQANNISFISRQFHSLAAEMSEMLKILHEIGSGDYMTSRFEQFAKVLQSIAGKSGLFADTIAGLKDSADAAGAASRESANYAARLADIAAQNQKNATSYEAVKKASSDYRIQELELQKTLITNFSPTDDAQSKQKASALKKINEDITAAQNAQGAKSRALYEQDLAQMLKLFEISARGSQEENNTALALGEIDAQTHDKAATQISIDMLNSKMRYEAEMSHISGITEAERKKHADAVTAISAEIELEKVKGMNKQLVDDHKDATANEDAMNKSNEALQKKLDALTKSAKVTGELASVTSANTASTLEQAAADTKSYLATIADTEANKNLRESIQRTISYLNEQAGLQRQISAAEGKGESNAAAAKAAKELDQYLDPKKAQQFGTAMRNAFGSAGAALGGLVDGMIKMNKQQELSALAFKNAQTERNAGTITETQYQQTLQDINDKSAIQQMGNYADMAGAASEFFGKNSTGYAIMQDAEKAFRAVELALAIQNAMVKAGLLTAGTGIFVAAKATETAVDSATTLSSIANSAIRATADGIAAVAKTVASIPFPYNVIAGAAVAAMLIGAGVKMSSAGGAGGGGAVTSQQQQDSVSGTVLGSPLAQSDSINNSLKIISANSTQSLTQTGALLSAFTALSNTMANMTTALLQSVGIGVSGGINSPVSLSSGGFGSSIFGGKQSLTGQGINFSNSTVGNASQGINASSYTNVTTSGGWFSGDSTSTQTTSLGAAAAQQFGLAITQTATAIQSAAGLLGIGGKAFSDNLNSFVVSIGKINTQGMTSAQVETALQAAFAKQGDLMAQWAVAGIGAFTKAGEGALQTLVRVATDYASIDASLKSVGMTFGTVGMSSLTARENLISLAGSLDNLTKGISYVQSTFMSQAQQTAPLVADLGAKMYALGLGSITTQAQFLALYQSLNLSTTAGQAMLVALNNIAPEFAQVTQYQTDLANNTLKLTSVQTAAQTTLQNAYNAQASALNNVISSMGSFASATEQFRSGLSLGSLSTLTPAQQYAAAQQQYQSVLKNLNSTDPTVQSNAQGQLQSASTAFLTASQNYNSSSAQYQKDYAAVQQQLAATVSSANSQASTAQQQLNALNNQVAGLITVNASVLTVQQGTVAVNNAVNAMNAALGITLTTTIHKMIYTIQTQTDLQGSQTAAVVSSNQQAITESTNQIVSAINGNGRTGSSSTTRMQIA